MISLILYHMETRIVDVIYGTDSSFFVRRSNLLNEEEFIVSLYFSPLRCYIKKTVSENSCRE